MWYQPEAQDYIPAGVRNVRKRWQDFWHGDIRLFVSAETMAKAFERSIHGQIARYGAGPDPRRIMTDQQARILLGAGGIVPTNRRRR